MGVGNGKIIVAIDNQLYLIDRSDIPKTDLITENK